MFDHEEIHGTGFLDYGFAIAHFIEAAMTHNPRQVFSSFEILDEIRADGFSAHAEYSFLDHRLVVHKCDVFGSEVVMSTQPQSISEAIADIGSREVAGEIRIDRDSGEIYLRHRPESESSREIERTFEQWCDAVSQAIGRTPWTVVSCRVDGRVITDVRVERLHFTLSAPPELANRVGQFLGGMGARQEAIADYSEVANWLRYAALCPV